ncbi:MAG TPA: polysaccharide biosynthesis/export family protein [Bauldia sp.]|nr:polysaccharide biosynthesis/export family protein [Bauldia sp.]
MRLHVLPVLLGLVLLGGCAGSPFVPDATHSELVAPYQLDAGDQLRVIVFGQDDLSNTYVVDQSGHISMPLIGAVPARGMTTATIEAEVGKRLRNGFLRNPDVSVEVSQYRPFFAMGEVGNPGQFAFLPGMTVQQAIAVAGGFTPRADKFTVEVTRSYGGRVESAQLKLSDPIMPGDTLYIRERII